MRHPFIRALLIVGVLAGTTSELTAAEDRTITEPKADHITTNGFVNPLVKGNHGSLWSFLKARFRSGKWAKYDPERYTVPTATPAPVTTGNPGSGNATATWIGHSTMLVQHKGVNVLTDPVFSQYASPVGFAGPKRITQPALEIDKLPPIDVVVVSHDHYDHLDTWSIKRLGNHPMYFVPLGIRDWMIGKGIKGERVVELDWWQSTAVQINGEQLRVTATPTQHFSGRGLFDRDKRLWASWAIEWSNFGLWFGGDTGYNDQQFREIGSRIGQIDMGIIPIGAYDPEWFMGTVHVNPEDAVRIHQDIGARHSIGIHWGAFLLTAEEVDEPPRRLAAALTTSNLPADSFAAFAVGETRQYPTRQF